MIGIYKITSPSGRIYIGQSIDIEKRFKDYRSLNNCKSQIKLYNSFLKHGVENHFFNIIKICKIDELNFSERYFQEFLNVIYSGLNLKYQSTLEKKQVHSIQTKEKISKSLKGIFVKEKNPMFGKHGFLNPMFGKKHNNESLIKMSDLHYKRKNILDLNTGIFYHNLLDLSIVLGFCKSKSSKVVLTKKRYVYV